MQTIYQRLCVEDSVLWVRWIVLMAGKSLWDICLSHTNLDLRIKPEGRGIGQKKETLRCVHEKLQ